MLCTCVCMYVYGAITYSIKEKKNIHEYTPLLIIEWITLVNQKIKLHYFDPSYILWKKKKSIRLFYFLILVTLYKTQIYNDLFPNYNLENENKKW